MFGYLMIKKEDLKIKDYETYRAFYCGLCKNLKDQYGHRAQATLTYDMTFLAILLTGLYESRTEKGERYCAVHPGRKHVCLSNSYIQYAADMNVLLAYYDLMDDWEDEKKRTSLAAARMLKKSAEQAGRMYPRQKDAIETYLKKLHQCETERSENLDLAAGLTGDVLAEIYVPKEDVWSGELRQLGFYIGKFIYLMDAYEDTEKDRKSGNYNPLLSLAGKPDFDEKAEQILLMMTAEASRAFEKLPILEHVDILRNILYAGIWTKFEMQKSRQKSQKEEKH